MSQKPFTLIAKCIAKAENLKENIQETVQLAGLLGEKLLLIYIGKRDQEDERQLNEVIVEYSPIIGTIEVLWSEGDPAGTLLRISQERKVDLVMVGAQPREGLLRYYTGSLARQLIRGLNCSILLTTNRNKTFAGKTAVYCANHPKTPYTYKVAQKVAGAFSGNILVALSQSNVEKLEESDVDHSLEISSSMFQSEDSNEGLDLDKISGSDNLEIIKDTLRKGGYALSNYVEINNIELLIMNSPDTKIGFVDRVFTHELEYILSELPSDLLLVHSHVNKS